ncbi:MAG: alpha amylase C-terminal domain-containing protein [Anaerolineae bacterium]|nr:alpha amylase C-terminal domain-containing protein [Anaerolineae bacterium]
MGAIPYPGGVTFRVWAPYAEAIYVAGTFNAWSATANPLISENNGYWSVDVPGARARNDHYKYVIINGTQTLWRIDPYAHDVTHATGNTIIHDPQFDWNDAGYRTPPWHEMVIYEMHIGTFNDTPGGVPGNLNGVIAKLPYLKDLGINAVQVMPPMEFAGGFSWGYNPAHIFAIESDYGGSDAFKTFIQTAHAYGIAVIFDVVYNHLGPSDLDLWQFDGWNENNKGGIYFYNDWRSTTPWGDTRPDYGRPEVRQYFRDNALNWLEAYHVDGLRWDATAYIRNVHGSDDAAHDIPEGWQLMQWINDEIDVRQPWKISIAEDLRGNSWLTKATHNGGAGFDAQWDAHFVHPIRQALTARYDSARDMVAVRDALTFRYNADAFQRIIYTESHDEVANGNARVPYEITPNMPGGWRAKKLSTVGAALVFTAPGIPMIFQGQEFLEDEWFHDQDPIDWNKQTLYGGILNLYRDLIRLRQNYDDTTRGLRGQHIHVHHLNNDDKLIAFHRWDQGGPRDCVIVVVNFANRSYNSYTLGFPREGMWRVRFNSDWRGYDTTFDNQVSYDTIAYPGAQDAMPCHGNVSIGPYSVIILSQDT